jgi:hypothetical protein
VRSWKKRLYPPHLRFGQKKWNIHDSTSFDADIESQKYRDGNPFNRS